MYSDGYESTMEAAGIVKTAARRAQKILRNMVNRGEHDRAAEFSKKLHRRGQDVDGYTPREHIKELGAGSEGVADLISTPKGLEVLKQYNPHSSLVNDRTLNRKEDFFRQMNERGPIPAPKGQSGHTDVAKLHGVEQRGTENPVKAFRHEYVPGTSVNEMQQRAGKNTAGNVQRQELDRNMSKRQMSLYERGREMNPQAARGEGYVPTDTFRGHGNNVIRDPQGNYKVIDTIPMTSREHGVSQQQHRLGQQAVGHGSWMKTPDTSFNAHSDSPLSGRRITNDRNNVIGSMSGSEQKAMMYRGKDPVRVRSNPGSGSQNRGSQGTGGGAATSAQGRATGTGGGSGAMSPEEYQKLINQSKRQ